MNIFKKAVKYVSGLFLGAVAMVSGTAHAVVPVAVETAITDMATDAAAVAVLVLVAIIGVVAIKFIRKGL